ncbi:MAG: TfoX/Sxy family protein [Acidobacteria bacterium]|nr:TfoX/Sxy family protein [Acidobacteriota bacterium]
MPTTKLLDRVRAQLESMQLDGEIVEKAIVGGTGFLWKGNLVCGVSGDDLLVRLGKEGGADVRRAKAEAASFDRAELSVRRMIMGGRESKTWFLVSAEEVRTKVPLRTWIERAVAFAAAMPGDE